MEHQQKPRSKKEMTLYGLTMVAIGSCIGSGIFLTPAHIAGYLKNPIFILLIWGIGGLVAVTGALTFAELGARFPGAGGIYVYLKEAYNDFVAFLFGWANLLVVNTGAIAALSIACAYYLGFIIPLSETGKIVIAVSLIVIVTIINIFGVKKGELFSNVFTGLKLLGIVGIIVTGILFGTTEIKYFELNNYEVPTNLTSAFGLALIGVIFSYGGFQHASFLAGEAKNPARTVPLAMIIGTLVVACIYILTNIAYLHLLPVSAIANSERVAADAINTFLPIGGIVIAIIIVISTFGTAGIFTLSAPRIYFAMAQDGIFFRKLAEIHPKYKTPVFAILIQSSVAILLLLFWKTFENLLAYLIYIDSIFLTLAAISIFVFRRRKKFSGDTYKTLGYPLTPLIFISVSLFLIVSILIEKPAQAVAGLSLLLLGVPVYYYFKRKNSISSKNS
ncbi:MAG: amino acid permease [Bacteroidia bacterium]|nr:amino acid permease [Bacteroidia bacterium]